MNQTAFDVWVLNNLEPDLIIAGNAKRYEPLPSWQEKNRLLDKEMEDIKKKIKNKNTK